MAATALFAVTTIATGLDIETLWTEVFSTSAL